MTVEPHAPPSYESQRCIACALPARSRCGRAASPTHALLLVCRLRRPRRFLWRSSRASSTLQVRAATWCKGLWTKAGGTPLPLSIKGAAVVWPLAWRLLPTCTFTRAGMAHAAAEVPAFPPAALRCAVDGAGERQERRHGQHFRHARDRAAPRHGVRRLRVRTPLRLWSTDPHRLRMCRRVPA